MAPVTQELRLEGLTPYPSYPPDLMGRESILQEVPKFSRSRFSIVSCFHVVPPYRRGC
jgi:hypothetical protein